MPLQIRRGTSGSLPSSPAEGEPLFLTDTQELAVGTGSSRVLMAKKDHTHAIADVTNLQSSLNSRISSVNGLTTTTGGGVTLSLDSLSDVAVTAPTNGQYLQFNGSNWVPTSGSGGNLDGLTDVVITSPISGQVLKYNGTNWVNGTDDIGFGAGGVTPADITLSAASRLVGSPDDDTVGTSIALSSQLSIAQVSSVDTLDIVLASSSGLEKSSGLKIAASGVTSGMLASDAVTTAKIADDAVTYAKLQNVSATDRILGRSTAGAGDVEEITCTSFARGLLDDTSASAMRATIDAAATSHTHAASDITSGTLDIARIPTGTTGTTVSFGNHTHAASAIDSGTLAVARGGTNLGTTPSNGQLLIGNGNGYTLATLTAGSNVTITNASGAITIASSGTTGSGTKTLEAWSATDNHPPSSAFAQFDTVNSIGVLNFDGATEEYAVFVGTIPEGATIGTTSGTAALKVRLIWTSTGIASNNGVVWGAAFDTFSGSEAVGNGTLSSVSTNSGTAPATTGYPITTEITVNGENHGSLAAGDFYRLRISRVVGNGSDTMSTQDAQLVAVELRIA